MKCLSLFSGGLDSILAIKVIQEQNIEVEAVYIDIGFEANKNKIEYLKNIAKQIDVKLTIIDNREEYVKNILFNPVYGYGKNFNPCIDCHANMIRKAFEYMEEAGAKFIINGEVLGQRPMSQRRDAMRSVNKLSKADGLILRPLSAKLLPPTIPEIEGWVDREKLLDIQGRTRHRQLELAQKYGLEGFESPGGGCLLTDENIAKRIKIFNHFTHNEIDILKVGRHFDVDGVRIIISRNKDENPPLREYQGNFLKMKLLNTPGPLGLIQENASNETKQLAADMMVSYSKANEDEVLIGNEIFKGKKRDKGEFREWII